MEEMAGASAAMLHVPQPPPYEDHRTSDQQHNLSHSHTGGRGGSRGRGGRGRGRGRGNGKQPTVNANPSGTATPAPGRTRLQRPKINMMPRTLADVLEEPKIALMHRVVNIAGPDIAWKALMETLTIEEHGGLEVNADACGRPAHMLQVSSAPQPRRRTKGGVFLTMLKTHVPKEVYKKIFEVEEDLKKKRKKQMRYVKHQKMESKINELPLQELFISGVSGGVTRATELEDGEDGEIHEDVAMGDA